MKTFLWGSLMLVVLLFGGCQTPPRQIYIERVEAPAPLQPSPTKPKAQPRSSPARPSVPASETLYSTVAVERGLASYYYGRWIGRKTASGEIYRATDVTAAHKTLPFNTRVRVTNLRNNQSVIVRINNRGPYVKGRIIDLSLEAARRISMTQAGVVPVKLEVLREIPIIDKPNLRRPPPPPSPSPTPSSRGVASPPPKLAPKPAPSPGSLSQRSSIHGDSAATVEGKAR